MKREWPALSFRQDAIGDMAGAIFMSNTLTREQCFKASIFGLPLEYEPFVSNVRKGMPLFLFDHTLCKLYGVFEAASDGGLNINNAAFRSTQRSYPAQVRINIIWKCRPLSEDEFSPAIEDNYYLPKKFYFDLSYEQVVRLYELFDNRRVQLPIHEYSKNESLETNRSSKRRQDKESMTPDVPHSIDQSRLLVPNISEVVRRYSTATSMHTDLPLSVETHPNMSKPLGTEIGAQIASAHRRHDQIEFQSQSELFPAAVMTDAVSTQVSAPCSQTSRHYQLVAKQPYPSPQDYQQNILRSGCTTQDPTEGAKFIATQTYPLSSGYLHSGSLTSGYATPNSTYNGRSHLNPSFAPYDSLYPGLSLSNLQSNSDYQVHCDICLNRGRSSVHNSSIYECERQRFSEGEAPTPAKLSLQCIPTYTKVLERDGKTVPAIDQKRNCADYIQIPYYDVDIENDQMRYGGPRSNASSSDLENDIVDPRHTQHNTRAESKTKNRCSPPQRSVFSRLTLNKQLSCQESTGPTLNQLVSSLSQKTEQWSHKNKPIADGLVIPLIGEEAMDHSHEELNLPSQLELGEESMEPQVPFYNFKRRSEAGKVDGNLGKEISGKVKRRKLVCPSFEENNASTNVGEELKGNCTEDRKQNHLDVSENHFGIDLNIPIPSVDSNLLEEDNRMAVRPSVIKVLHEIEANKQLNSDVMEATKEQDPSGASTQKISIDLNVAELNSMDESKLQTILDQASLLLQTLGNLKSGKPNNTEGARSSVSSEDRKVNMA
ncbi:hypothetical protein PAHAL_2G125600 [Panicum hallii]|uniref:DCD domain-containing protein n=1 Tax=Panicum hallii TaxID=206008 RepID=A0A2S3GY18_9POAL|nr:uncharacterized protein LOC112882368 [Panicum hallii]XP_025803200.1 uncharacterized protein LOC112882368 [Panicum hallii]PAN10925.1 hypothetical protein PAHAL_2G125600 [Panicum hallii]PAN10926.1 hypothetical protein PAHAL_2G125600 [Panicum hallii]